MNPILPNWSVTAWLTTVTSSNTPPRGMDALNKLALARPDAVLLDVLLPDMNGLKVCEILKRRSEPQRLPVILVSSLDNTVTRTAGHEAGARSFVAKPPDETKPRLRECNN